jgi:membrane protease YdiL (CAAX protease family)
MTDRVRRQLLLVEVAAAAVILVAGILPQNVSLDFDPQALAIGACCGFALFVALAGRQARLLIHRQRPGFVGVGLILTTAAAAKEEVLFRGILMAVFAQVYTALPALVLSAGIFAGAHDHQGATAVHIHFLTGAVFGAVLALTWNLPAAIAAHAVYNGCILLASEAERDRTPLVGQPLAEASGLPG